SRAVRHKDLSGLIAQDCSRAREAGRLIVAAQKLTTAYVETDHARVARVRDPQAARRIEGEAGRTLKTLHYPAMLPVEPEALETVVALIGDKEELSCGIHRDALRPPEFAGRFARP